MRILACADLHGRPDRIARVRELIALLRPDVVLLPGDLTHAGTGLQALDLLEAPPVPTLAVGGNMDDDASAARIRLAGRLQGPKPVEIAGVTFGGPAAQERCDVLVVHEPPYGVLDRVPSGRRIGSRAVLELARRLRPRVLACGHVHESPGVERLGETLVVNCTMGGGTTGGALIELLPERVTARLLPAAGPPGGAETRPERRSAEGWTRPTEHEDNR